MIFSQFNRNIGDDRRRYMFVRYAGIRSSGSIKGNTEGIISFRERSPEKYQSFHLELIK